MFGKGKLAAMEEQLSALRQKAEDALKEKTKLVEQLSDTRGKLKEAQEKIRELENRIAETDLSQLQQQARQSIAEYEGLKELYQQKNQEIDAVRETTEEGFAREAANKRLALSDEIARSKQDNQNMIKDTVQTFAGSYRYYLDQIRVLMDALCQAATDTGEHLFEGEVGDIQASFGARIVEQLRNDTDTLPSNTGDKLLIGAEKEEEAAEESEAPEEPEEPEAPEEPEEEPAEPQAEPEAPEFIEEAAEQAEEIAQEAAELIPDEVKSETAEGPEA